MDIAFWCVLIVGLLPLVCAGIAKFGTSSQATRRFDNNNPRDWLAEQQGARKRANAAQANSWEAFPMFAAGVIIAHLQHAELFWINTLALIFILARLLYIAAYLGDQATLRTMLWTVSWAASIGLFVLAATGSLR